MLNERSQVYNQAAKGVDLNVCAIRQHQDIEDMRKTLSAFLDASTKQGTNTSASNSPKPGSNRIGRNALSMTTGP